MLVIALFSPLLHYVLVIHCYLSTVNSFIYHLEKIINTIMKISELTSYKNSPAYQSAIDLGSDSDPGYTAYSRDAVEPLIGRLGDLGWKNIGKGYEGLVFSNPNKSYVVKLFIPTVNSKELLKFIINNQSNKHVPKLRGKPVKINKNSDVLMIRMEKLEPITSEFDPLFSQYFPPEKSGGVWDLWELYYDDPKWLKTNHPDLYEIIHFTYNMRNEPDYHIGNIMKRNNTFVIIDL